MITHNSFKLIMDAKDKEANILRNDLHNTKLRLAHFEREHNEIFTKFFRRPVSNIHLKGDGIVEVRTESGETLLFEINLIGEVVQ